ncbi:hypothetical protein BC827DRAFT_1193596 [Russula dissimulans]|nr:hypothetical protein BC827DRAFT_1193596 [Russula dissimulans]
MTLPPFTASVRVKQEPVTQVKHEPSNSDPTPFRSETYNAPNPEVGRSGGSEDQSLTSVAEPSQALWDEYFRYQSNQRKRSDPAPPVKQEPSTSQPMAPPHPTQSRGTVESIDFVPREHFPSFKRIKPERGSDEDVQPWKRPKSEIT